MGISKISISKIWREIEETLIPDSKNGIVKRLILPEFKNKLFLGVELETKKRLFVFEAPYKVLRDIGSLPQTNGFEASIRFLGDEEDNYLSLFLVVKKDQFNDLFESLIIDILNHLDDKDTKQSVDIVILRLLRWQKFLERFNHEGLSEEAQRGLYGELYFLNRLLEAGIDIRTVTGGWKGPERTVHDFIFQNCAIEVKTSISKQHQKLYISSERQLDDKQSGKLYLCHYSLDHQSSMGYSLVQIIGIIRGKLNNAPLQKDMFEEKLFDSGYLDKYSERYNTPIYSIREYNLFRVVNGFPRILEDDLIEGVGDVRYSVMVTACKNYSIQESEVLQLIGDAETYG